MFTPDPESKKSAGYSLALFMSAIKKTAFWRLAPLKSALASVALVKSVSFKSARRNWTFFRFASSRSSPLKLAELNIAPSRLIPFNEVSVCKILGISSSLKSGVKSSSLRFLIPETNAFIKPFYVLLICHEISGVTSKFEVTVYRKKPTKNSETPS